MGMSETGHLIFGVPLGDEAPFEDSDGDTDIATYLAERAGLADPWAEVPEEVNYGPYDKFQEWEKANPEWRKKQKKFSAEKEKLYKASPVTIEHAGYHDYPHYILALKGTEYYAWAGDVTEIDPDKLVIDPEKVRDAVLFCDENGLPDFEGATWLLYASYG